MQTEFNRKHKNTNHQYLLTAHLLMEIFHIISGSHPNFYCYIENKNTIVIIHQ